MKKIKKPVPAPEPILESEESAQIDQNENIEERPKITRPKIKNLWLKIILVLFIIALITLFWAFSLYRAKAKITNTTSGLNKDFSAFLDAISNKDTISLSKYIDSFNQKSESSLLILQSNGQDIYILSLLYPKGKRSQMTAMIDTIRAGHLLTNSYEKFINTSSATSATSGPKGAPFGGNDWTAKANNFLDKIKQYNSGLPSKIIYAKIASQEAKAILANTNNSDFSTDEKKTAENLKKLADTSTVFFDYLSDLPNELNQNLTFSGGKKSYLILFQNNAEIRPGGGFLGSFARLDLENGGIKNIDFEKNIYTLDKSFLASGGGEQPPKEYTSLFSTLLMRDSNNYSDFSQSAKNVMRFYKEESGRDVDGVIAIDTTLFRNLLKVTGPIPMPEYNLNVTADNFLSDVQYQVEIGYYQNQANWAENQPKKILADMMPKFLNALFKESNRGKTGQAIMTGVTEKHLLFYFNSSKLEDLANGINAAGKVHQSSGDYLYLSDANIGGYKSSLNITETVKQNVSIDAGGNISEKLAILRKHNGTNVWPDGVNNNYIKIYLPLASKIESVNLVAGDNNPRSDQNKAEADPSRQPVSPSQGGGEAEAEKYQVGGEYEKTTVAFWQNTKPGETSQTNVSYSRTNAVDTSDASFDWQITIQKQPGIENYDWQLDLVYPEGWKPQNVDGYDQENRQIILTETIKKDSVFRLRFIHSQ